MKEHDLGVAGSLALLAGGIAGVVLAFPLHAWGEARSLRLEPDGGIGWVAMMVSICGGAMSALVAFMGLLYVTTHLTDCAETRHNRIAGFGGAIGGVLVYILVAIAWVVGIGIAIMLGLCAIGAVIAVTAWCPPLGLIILFLIAGGCSGRKRHKGANRR